MHTGPTIEQFGKHLEKYPPVYKSAFETYLGKKNELEKEMQKIDKDPEPER